MANANGGPKSRRARTNKLRILRSDVAAAWADVSHALRGFCKIADILIVLDEVLCLEVSNLARQLNFNPEVGDDHPVIAHLTASLWFRSMDLTITSSTSRPGAKQREEECDCSREASGVEEISSNARKRKMAVLDPKT